MNVIFILFSKPTYLISFFFISLALLITFFHRAEYFDEAWFAEQSFWLLRDGQVRSELFRGYNGWENGLYVFHKLFIYAGALVMSITGVTVASSKVVSIFFGILGGYLVWLYQKNGSQEQRWLSVLLYFSCGTLIRFISVNRPETMCMALGFASYLVLDPPGNTRPKPVVAGILAGLAALTHLNGLIYLIAGAMWLVINVSWRSTLFFIVAGALTLSLYGIDAILDGNMPVLMNQFFNDPATQENFNLSDKLAVLADYHHLFFHSQNEGALTALVLLCAIAFRKKIRLSQPILLYTILLIVSFWFLTKSDTDIYFLLFVPWLAVLAASWLIVYLPEQPVWQKKVSKILLFFYALIALIQVREVILENQTSPNTEAYNALLASNMPHHKTKVIAPIKFFFGQMDNYKIKGLTYYLLYEQRNKKIPLLTFFQDADREGVEYIISDYGKDSSYDIPPNTPNKIGVYKRVFQDDLHTIYARQSEDN
ncbi:ArnT family glycosyltransferase [Spirosoma humi]